MHYRTLEYKKELALGAASGNYEETMRLSADSIAELEWWIRSIPTAYRNIDHGVPQIVITTAASNTGWGATSNGNSTQGLWAAQETAYHINVREMLAVQFRFKSLLVQVKNQHVRVISDNMTTVTYVNAMGGCKSNVTLVTLLLGPFGHGLLITTIGYLRLTFLGSSILLQIYCLGHST